MNKRWKELQEELRSLKGMLNAYWASNDASEMSALWTEIEADLDRIIDEMDRSDAQWAKENK